MTAAPSHPRVFTPGFVALLAFALAALVVLLALGNWQVRRLAWKEDLLATIETRRTGEPRPLDAVLADARAGDPVGAAGVGAGALDYRPVRATGAFERDEALFHATDRGAVGYQVLQPLRLADGRALIVNRGFVPEAIIGAEDWRGGEGDGDGGAVTVEGLARDPLHEKPNRFVPDNDGIFYWKDFDAIRDGLGLAADETVPMILDVGPTPPGTVPVGGQTIVNLPNNHFGYAVTWYGIAVGLVGVVVALVSGRVRRARGAAAGAGAPRSDPSHP